MEVDDYVAAVYDCKAYVGKVLEVDELDVHISFFAHKGDLPISTHSSYLKYPMKFGLQKKTSYALFLAQTKTSEEKGQGWF